jgi:hypothetical protein
MPPLVTIIFTWLMNALTTMPRPGLVTVQRDRHSLHDAMLEAKCWLC